MNYKLRNYNCKPKKQPNIIMSLPLPPFYFLMAMFFISIKEYKVALVLAIITVAFVFNILTNYYKRILEEKE